jgi:hypothetical protein
LYAQVKVRAGRRYGNPGGTMDARGWSKRCAADFWCQSTFIAQINLTVRLAPSGPCSSKDEHCAVFRRFIAWARPQLPVTKCPGFEVKAATSNSDSAQQRLG